MEKENERNAFWNKILNILRNDCTQDCNDSKGTKIRLQKEDSGETITILDGISHGTLQKLMATDYLVHCNNEGHLCIESFLIKR